MIKNCKWCGTEFDAKTTWQEFCTDAHRQADFQDKRRKAYKREQARQKQQTNPQPAKRPE